VGPFYEGGVEAEGETGGETSEEEKGAFFLLPLPLFLLTFPFLPLLLNSSSLRTRALWDARNKAW
jgi:hypothetical protein